jgi:hypothetical protein
MAAHEEFIAWALSPERTLEEAYCAERLVENGYGHWRMANQQPHIPWDQQHKLAKKRKQNPAHRAKLDPIIVARAAEKLSTLDRIDVCSWEDRPLRDISGLRFFPYIKHLSLHGHEFADVSVLRMLPLLEELCVSSHELEDLTPIASLTALKSLRIHLRAPWPIVTGFEALTALELFHWHGNLLPLEEIPRLGQVRDAKFDGGGHSGLPLRNATRLPEMPWLEQLELDGLHRLDGITRWPRLRNLIIGGPFKDLRPFTGLRGLTHLSLKGELTRDLAPLAQLPELRRLTVLSSHPQDYSVLAETPRLHEVIAQGCKINKMELATLHAVLAPWEDEFAEPEPRPRSRARFTLRDAKEFPKNPREALGPEARWEDDKQMAASECQWFANRLTAALSALLGRKGWGRVSAHANGFGWISLNTLEAAEQLAVVVETTRQLLCTTRLPWHVHLNVTLDDPDEEFDDEEEETEEQALQRELEDHRDYQKRRKEEEERLEREHRMRLLQQEGKPVSPDEFTSPDDTKTIAAGHAADSGEDDDEDEEENQATDEKEETLADRLWMNAVITEEGIIADIKTRQATEHLMGRKAEDAAA